MDQITQLRALCPDVEIRQGVSLSKFTTLRVGGPADCFAEAETEKQIIRLMQGAKALGLEMLVLGNGSNLLVRDGGFRGLAIHIGRRFSAIARTRDGLTAQAGALLSTLSRTALEEGLSGLEFAQGIPGSVGGGVYMNAGAYGGELGKVISSVRVLDGDQIKSVPAADMEFAYRHTRAMDEKWIVLSADFRLERGDPALIDAAMRDYAARRRDKQPLEYPSAGSFFKRPAGHFAGALIEQAGLKGLTVGGAQVSEKHAGFLINIGNASASDFLSLMVRVQNEVEKRFGVRLENEVRIVGSEK